MLKAGTRVPPPVHLRASPHLSPASHLISRLEATGPSNGLTRPGAGPMIRDTYCYFYARIEDVIDADLSPSSELLERSYPLMGRRAVAQWLSARDTRRCPRQGGRTDPMAV